MFLFSDRTGLTIVFKRLEAGTFQVPQVLLGATRAEINPVDLAMIMEGLDLRYAVRRERFSRQEDTADRSLG